MEKKIKRRKMILFENLNIFLRNGSIQDPNNSFLFCTNEVKIILMILKI